MVCKYSTCAAGVRGIIIENEDPENKDQHALFIA